MKIENIVLIESRLYENSTQIYLENVSFDGDEFYVPIGNYTKPIGYLQFKRMAKDVKAGCFELNQLIPLDYPNPNPKLSLTGVLYSRQEAIQAQKLFDSFGRVVDLTR